MPLQSINPATGEILENFSEQTAAEAAAAAVLAHEAFLAWSRSPFSRRSALLAGAAAILRAEKNSLARTMTDEMGKPILQSIAEIEKCALVCDYYAAGGEAMLRRLSR